MAHLTEERRIDCGRIGPRRAVTLPGVGITVGEQIEALERVAGSEAAGLVREAPDAAIWAIVKDWSIRFEARRARDLGFRAEETFDDIVRVHIEDELDGRRVPA